MTTTQIAVVAMCLLQMLFMVAVILVRNRLIDLRKERNPLADKLLRPAGESLRIRIDELTSDFTDVLLLGTASPLIFAVVLLSSPLKANFPFVCILIVGGLVFLGYLTRRMLSIANELRNRRLGFHGERAVAEELNQLMRDGCHVFHDVPMAPYGNIDHVVVAPSGVYAVETKTRRKRNAGTAQRDYEVIFDGKALVFPHGADTHGLDQARQQADRLRVLLAKAVGEPVPVTPILTLPGWFVTSRARADVKVVNPKNIRSIVKGNGAPALKPDLVVRVSHQLDQKCRDVEL